MSSKYDDIDTFISNYAAVNSVIAFNNFNQI